MRTVTENEYLIYDRPLNKSWRYYIRYIIEFGHEMILKALFISAKQYPNKKYNVCICGCFKNEGRFLKEWIEYNLLIGIDHFYLYNNNSDDNFKQVLQDYIDNGIVTLNDYPEIPAQPGVYKHWYKNYRHETDWVSFLDMDEFFVPYQYDNIKDWINKHRKYPVLLIYWKMFGTSGLLRHDDSKLVTEQYTVSWAKLDGIGKVLYNTNYDIVELDTGSMHGFQVRYRGFIIPPMNIFGHFVFSYIHKTSKKKIDIQLNHYWSKAFDIYELKHKRGSGAFLKSWKTFDKFCWHENHNTSTDHTIYRFLIQLKLRIIDNGNTVGEK